MIQIIRENKNPSFGQKFSNAVGHGLGHAEKFMSNRKQMQQMEQENEALRSITGIDLSGVVDPNQRKAIVTELMKQQGKQGLLGQKQEFLNQIFKGSSPEENASRFPQQLQGEQRQSGFDAQNISDEDIIKAENMGIRGLREAKDTALRESREDRNLERDLEKEKIKGGLSRDNKVLEEADKMRSLIPTEEASLNSIREAIILGDQSYFSPNNIAEKTGLEWFRDAAGGQFKTGSKTFLINNISKFGARPNQYIEQQIADSLAKVGRSKAANYSSFLLTKFDSDVKKEFLNQIDAATESDYKPGSLGKTAQKNMKDYVEKKQTELSNKLKFISNHEKQIDETPKGHYPMIDPEGNLVYIPEEMIDEAKFYGAVDL